MLNCNIFSEKHPYKIKVNKFIKVTTTEKDYYFIFLKTHGEAVLLLFDNNFTDVEILTRKEIMEEFNYEHTTSYTLDDFVIINIEKIEICEDYDFLDVYLNDDIYFCSNIFSLRNKSLFLNHNNYKEITKEEADKEIDNIIKEIKLSDEGLIEENNLDLEKQISILKGEIDNNPYNLELLYTIKSFYELPDLFESIYCLTFISVFKYNDILLYGYANELVETNDPSNYGPTITTYNLNKIKKIESEKIDKYLKVIKNRISNKDTKINISKPTEKCKYKKDDHFFNCYNHFNIEKGNLKFVEIEFTDSEHDVLCLEDFLEEIRKIITI